LMVLTRLSSTGTNVPLPHEKWAKYKKRKCPGVAGAFLSLLVLFYRIGEIDRPIYLLCFLIVNRF
jgi:hypothetical protein